MVKLQFMIYFLCLRRKITDLNNMVFVSFLKTKNVAYTIWMFTMRSLNTDLLNFFISNWQSTDRKMIVFKGN